MLKQDESISFAALAAYVVACLVFIFSVGFYF